MEWQPIETLVDVLLGDNPPEHFVCWNPCDGLHAMHYMFDHYGFFEWGGRHHGIFTHWAAVTPPAPSSPTHHHQPEADQA